MAAQNASVLARVERSGMGVIQPAMGLKALQMIMNFAKAQVIITAQYVPSP